MTNGRFTLDQRALWLCENLPEDRESWKPVIKAILQNVAEECYTDASRALNFISGEDALRLDPEVRETLKRSPEIGARMLLTAFAVHIEDRGREVCK
jgi:hypothetical protein